MGPKRDFSIFMKSMHGIFLIFFHEVKGISTLKMDQSNSFLKNLVVRFAGRKRPKRVQNEVFKFYGSKNFSFLFFSVAWRIKIVWNGFLGKNLNLKFFELKNGPKMGQKWGFSSWSKINTWNFSYFLHEVTVLWRIKINWWFVGKNLVLKFLSQKGLEWVFHV